MAQIISPRISNTETLMRRQGHKMNSGIQRKSALKNANNKSPRVSGRAAPKQGNDNDSDDDDDTAITDDDDETADEPAVFALPAPAFGYLAGHGSQEVTDTGDTNESEDDGYAEAASPSDDDESQDEDEGDVLRAAEEDLIEEFERTEQRRNAQVISTEFDNMLIKDQDNDEFDPLRLPAHSGFDMNDDPFVGLAATDSLYQEMWNDAESAMSSWRMPGRTDSLDSTGNKKRVRFQEQPSIEVRSRSSSLSSEDQDPNEVFPDLFTPHDDPMLRERYAIDHDPDATFQQDNSDAGSCYDFDGEEERMALKIDAESDSEGSAMSDYDSDGEGDTTDEETEEESMARMRALQRARGVMKSPRIAPQTPTPAKNAEIARSPGSRRPSTPNTARLPRAGTFVLDPTRAAMSADGSGKRIKVIPPARPSEKDKEFWSRAKSAGSRNTSPVPSPGYSLRSPISNDMPGRPFTAQSTLGSMFNGNLEFLRNNDVSGIGRDMYASMSLQPAASFSSTGFTEPSEEDSPEDVDMQDFIDLAGFESESDEPQSAVGESSGQDPFDAFTNDSSWGLLDHLEQQRGLVGSFRRNQSQAKQICSMPTNPHRRAALSETNALQKNRLGAANTPMTPARKKRASIDLTATGAGVKKNVSSPLANRRPRSRGGSISGSGLYQQ